MRTVLVRYPFLVALSATFSLYGCVLAVFLVLFLVLLADEGVRLLPMRVGHSSIDMEVASTEPPEPTTTVVPAVNVPARTPPPPPTIEEPKETDPEELEIPKEPEPKVPPQPEPVKSPPPVAPPPKETVKVDTVSQQEKTTGTTKTKPGPKSPLSSSASDGTDYDEAPDIYYNPTPPYPADALARKLEGMVEVLVEVDASGRVRSAKLHRSSGLTSFDEAAVTTVRYWVLYPAKKRGRPVAASVIVPVRFEIRTAR
jgi:protein TonB